MYLTLISHVVHSKRASLQDVFTSGSE